MDAQQHRRRGRRFGLFCVEQRVLLGLYSPDLLEQQFEPIEFSTNLGFEMLGQATHPGMSRCVAIGGRGWMRFRLALAVGEELDLLRAASELVVDSMLAVIASRGPPGELARQEFRRIGGQERALDAHALHLRAKPCEMWAVAQSQMVEPPRIRHRRLVRPGRNAAISRGAAAGLLHR
jgi:hypothetical protein